MEMRWRDAYKSTTLTNPSGWQTRCGKENLEFHQFLPSRELVPIWRTIIPSFYSALRLTASQIRVPAGSLPDYPHVGIVQDDGAGRRVYSGISCFPLPLHSGASPYLASPSSALKVPFHSTLLFHIRRASPKHIAEFCPVEELPGSVSIGMRWEFNCGSQTYHEVGHRGHCNYAPMRQALRSTEKIVKSAYSQARVAVKRAKKHAKDAVMRGFLHCVLKQQSLLTPPPSSIRQHSSRHPSMEVLVYGVEAETRKSQARHRLHLINVEKIGCCHSIIYYLHASERRGLHNTAEKAHCINTVSRHVRKNITCPSHAEVELSTAGCVKPVNGEESSEQVKRCHHRSALVEWESWRGTRNMTLNPTLLRSADVYRVLETGYIRRRANAHLNSPSRSSRAAVGIGRRIWMKSQARPADLFISTLRGRSDRSFNTLASHQGDPGSIPDWVIPGFSHVRIVPDDAIGRLVFSGISRFPHTFIPALLHTHLNRSYRL
ncbi:hypothetical protein PR048_017907 [Dryococelus australis]|uniref:Uncharacterized protein n=1 Tax=Dryococelus australis TaxID=614101 RepID=A0ABQ9HAY5_9NEOP|nr:hypothetical protein PR048_017907 [Dryococelus australis]